MDRNNKEECDIKKFDNSDNWNSELQKKMLTNVKDNNLKDNDDLNIN